MSSGFTGTSTRVNGGFIREVETRMKKRLDVFTDDFSPPGTSDVVSGQDVSKSNGGYGKPHDDSQPSKNYAPAKVSSAMHSAGDPKEQEAMDNLDEEVYRYESGIKQPKDQFPGSLLKKRLAGTVDEGLWSKAKDASTQAFGKVKWPFVEWWYTEHGGK